MRNLSVILAAASLSFSVSAVASEAQPAPVKEKLICKRTAETGSLVKAKRECLTKAQWSRKSEHAKTETERMIGPMPGNVGGN